MVQAMRQLRLQRVIDGVPNRSLEEGLNQGIVPHRIERQHSELRSFGQGGERNGVRCASVSIRRIATEGHQLLDQRGVRWVRIYLLVNVMPFRSYVRQVKNVVARQLPLDPKIPVIADRIAEVWVEQDWRKPPKSRIGIIIWDRGGGYGVRRVGQRKGFKYLV